MKETNTDEINEYHNKVVERFFKALNKSNAEKILTPYDLPIDKLYEQWTINGRIER